MDTEHKHYHTLGVSKLKVRKKRVYADTVLGNINECVYCEKTLTDNNRSKDHIYPKSLGGKETIWCCKECNHLKSDRRLWDWYFFVLEMKIPEEDRDKRLINIKKLMVKYKIDNWVIFKQKEVI